MKRKVFALLSVLTILGSTLGAFMGPADPAGAVPLPGGTGPGSSSNYGWVNRFVIIWDGEIYYDGGTYDRIYNYVNLSQQASAPTNNCQPDEIMFYDSNPLWFPNSDPKDPKQRDRNAEYNNVGFFYGNNDGSGTKSTYEKMRAWHIWYTPQPSAPGAPCEKHTEGVTIANSENRKIVLIKWDNDTIVTLNPNPFMTDDDIGDSLYSFKKMLTTFPSDGRNNAMYISPDTNSLCRDRIVEFPARALNDGGPIHNSAGGIPNTYTLYNVEDSNSTGQDEVSQSYINDIAERSIQFLHPCYVPFDGDVFMEVTERGYGLTAANDPFGIDGAGWGSGRIVANGLIRGGGWDEGGESDNDAFVVYVGTKDANYVQAPPGVLISSQPTGSPPPNNTLCGQASLSIGGLGWLFCSLAEQFQSGIIWMEGQIEDKLRIDSQAIFGRPSDSYNQDFRRAWIVFRNVAYALLVILGLIMVISQILGLDLFDAYTIRKMLPKVVIVTILIPLLWPIFHILLDMSNDAAGAVQGLLMAPFQGGETSISKMNLSFLLFGDGRTPDAAGGTVALGGLFAGSTFLAIGGWGVTLALIGSGLLALGVSYITLVIRDMVVYGFIILSSVIIVGTIFPPTAAAANKAIRAVGSAVIVQIIVMFYLSLGKVAAWIAYNTGTAHASAGDTVQGRWWGVILAITSLIVSYVMAWKYFQQAFQWSKAVNAVFEKAQQGLAKYRGEALKKRLNEAIEGRRQFGGPLGWGANRVAGVMRRGRLAGEVGAGAFGFGRTGRAKYREAVRTMQAGVAAKMMEQDKDRAGGDDDAMRLLARRGMTGGRFIREYSDLMQRSNPGMSRGEAEERARRALGLSETSLGANAGTDAMRIAAQRSLLKSNTSYRRQMVQQPDGSWRNEEMDFRQMSRTMYGDVSELVQDGLITVADGASMIKSNQARMDRAGVGFGGVMAAIDRVSRGGVGTLDEVNPGDPSGGTHMDALLNDVLTGSSPAQWAGQRHETVRILAPEMRERLRRAVEADYAGTGGERLTLGRPLTQLAASAAGTVDVIGTMAELNRDPVASAFLGARIRPPRAGEREEDVPTMRQLVELYRTPVGAQRDSPIYREIQTNYAQDFATRTGRPANDPAVQRLAHEETEREIRNAQRVFNEHRREYDSETRALAGQAGQPNP